MKQPDWFHENPDKHQGNARLKAQAANGMRKRIEERGGKLTAASLYENSGVRVKFLCAEGHEASISRDKLVAGAWCTACNPLLRYTVGQELVRLAMQHIWQVAFPSAWLEFMINPETGARLQLDGYSEEIKLAFEHNGRQHDEYNPFFHGNLEEFEKAQARDLATLNLANKNGIDVVLVPQVNRCASPEEILQWVSDGCRATGRAVPSYSPEGFDISSAFRLRSGRERLAGSIASHGGTLRSDYLGWERRVSIKCSNEAHPIWEVTPISIVFQKTWCPRCAAENMSKRIREESYKEVLKWLKEHRDVTLRLSRGEEYLGHSERHAFLCTHGHLNFSMFREVERRHKERSIWCMECYATPTVSASRSIGRHAAEAEEIANNLGFKITFVSIAADTRGCFTLQCLRDETHIIERSIHQLRGMQRQFLGSQKIACQYCGRRHKKTLEDAQVIASVFDGRFLDPEFNSVKETYSWELNGILRHTTYDTLNSICRRNNVVPGKSKGTLTFSPILPKTLDEAVAFASANGGEFLDEEFKGVKYPHNWKFGDQQLVRTMDVLQNRFRRRKSQSRLSESSDVRS